MATFIYLIRRVFQRPAKLSLHNRRTPVEPFAKVEEGKSPRHQASLQSGFDLSRAADTQLTLRYVDRLKRGDVPAYLELDARLNWRFSAHGEFSLSGENLLDHYHPEFTQEGLTSTISTESTRSFWGKLQWSY